MNESDLQTIVRGIAPVVREYVTKAVGDLVTRLTAAEARIVLITDTEKSVGELRERVAVAETKAATPPVAPPPPVDLAPLLERLAAAEARLSVLGDLRDRVVTVEAKSAVLPTPTVTVDHEPVLNDLRARVSTLETRTADDSLTKALGVLSERVAVTEVKAGVPGPAGKDGANGKDGVDGVGFEDMAVEFDGDRTLSLRFERGGVSKVFPITLPFLRYQDVFQEGKTYTQGDIVTWGGSTWHANETTKAKPGDGSKAWTLAVKRGRDGKDGRDALDPVPVVKVR